MTTKKNSTKTKTKRKATTNDTHTNNTSTIVIIIAVITCFNLLYYIKVFHKNNQYVNFLLNNNNTIRFDILADEKTKTNKEKEELVSYNYNITTYNNNEYNKKNQMEFIFPSIHERVKYYMGHWYNNGTVLDQNEVCSRIRYYKNWNQWYHIPFIYDGYNMPDQSGIKGGYKGDMLTHYYKHVNKNCRFILQFADQPVKDKYYPIMIKHRKINTDTSTSNNNNNFPKPIIAYMNSARHFKPVDDVIKLKKKNQLIPWEKKHNSMIWRGTSTGGQYRFNVVRNYINSNKTDIDIAFSGYVPGTEKFMNITEHKMFKRNTISMKTLLSYKYLLSLEGYDVATGLKWMLYSNSVVFMSLPTSETWTMEYKLIPFYHYIPLNNNNSNIYEMIEWAKQNDEKCKNISLHATQYIEDLYASKKAKKTNDKIISIIAKRYQNLYGTTLQQCPKD